MKNIFYLILLLALVFTTDLYSQTDNAGADVTGEVYDIVDRKPRLEGFRYNYDKYFEKYRNYPKEAYMKGKEGKVFVSFVVTTSGEVADLFISRSTDEIFNLEALRLVKTTSGHWTPGKKDGKEVNTRMVLPVRFNLTEGDKSVVELLSSFDEGDEIPLFVLDKKIVQGIVHMPDYNIRSIRLLKGEKAVKFYGEKGKNGVVEITTKNGTPPIYKW
jgi:TonB family protein